ncbi:MAG: PPC domain-containing DNA-binding protein [Burkholderiales bacterium]
MTPVRLVPGDDLRNALLRHAGVEGAFVLSGIGSLAAAAIRFAGRPDVEMLTGPLEIVSLAGTLTPNGAHLHVVVSDGTGRVTGGHVGAGCIVRTTVEALVASVAGYRLSREPDPRTGYAELVVRRDEA